MSKKKAKVQECQQILSDTLYYAPPRLDQAPCWRSWWPRSTLTAFIFSPFKVKSTSKVFSVNCKSPSIIDTNQPTTDAQCHGPIELKATINLGGVCCR